MPEALLVRGLRDFGSAASLIHAARQQSRFFLSEQPCATCDHEGSRRSDSAPIEEVVRLSADLSVA
jgi:hypothetical protein